MFARAAVLMLVMMNLAAIGWLWQRAPLAPSPPPALDLPPLRLLGEVEASALSAAGEQAPELSSASANVPMPSASADDAAPAGEGSDEPAYGAELPESESESGTAQCLSLGPFESQAELRRVMSTLQALVESMQFRELQNEQVRGYRVFLPPAPDRETALAAARELSAQGVRDYYVVTAGEAENTVSLGLFRDRGNAERRLREVRALGHDARMEERTETRSQWWLDFVAEPEFDWRMHVARPWPARSTPIACHQSPSTDPRSPAREHDIR